MVAETAREVAALETQTQKVMAVFAKAGYEAVSPAIIQPADVFLEVVGEDLRSRTYVFTDQEGDELCLRPDLTVPTCRLHLSRFEDPATPARYSYSGPAFRFQPYGADSAHPREFLQAGIESFADTEREAAEARIIAHVVAAVEAAGLKRWSLTIGDLGLFGAVLRNAGLPDRWRHRLKAAFWQPSAFRAELKRLIEAPGAAAARLPKDIAALVDHSDLEMSEARVAGYFEDKGIEPIGTRTIADMTAHLIEMAEDAVAKPLDPATAQLIERYASVSAPCETAGREIASILEGAKGGVGAALDIYDRRLALLANAGIDLKRITYSAAFGRNLEYYTGLVFEVVVPGLGRLSPVAGGGRYDGLMRAVGAGKDVAAVGAAIHSERLLAAVAEEGA